MVFTVNSSSLLKQLQLAGGALSSNPVIQILENFLFKIDDGNCAISATNLDTAIITKVEVQHQGKGAITIPGKILLETLKSLPEQPITFSVNLETSGIELTSSFGKYKLVGNKAEDFPEIPMPSVEDKVTLDTHLLHKAIDKTLFATSNDEMRPAMKGVCLSLDFNHVVFVATDAHKLVKYTFLDHKSDVASSMILPKKSLSLIKSVLPGHGNVVLHFDKAKAFFTFNDAIVSCRLIEAKFPDYNAVIPVNNPNILSANRVDLLNCLRRLNVFANKSTNQVVFNIQDKSLTISAQDLDFSNEATEQLPCSYSGEPMSIGFNGKFLIEMLNTIESEEIKMELSTPNRPGILSPMEQEDKENLMMLVMPVMLGY